MTILRPSKEMVYICVLVYALCIWTSLCLNGPLVNALTALYLYTLDSIRTAIRYSALKSFHSHNVPAPGSNTAIQPHLYPISTPSLPHFYPISTSSLPHLYPISTPSLPHLYPISTPSLPHLYLISTPSLPHLYPISTPSPGYEQKLSSCENHYL